MARKIIAITMGDPAGVGPEIISAYWARRLHGSSFPRNASSDTFSDPPPDKSLGNSRRSNGPPLDAPQLLVVGRPEVMQRAIELLGVDIELIELNELSDLPNAGTADEHRKLFCLAAGQPCGELPLGQISAAAGQAAYDAVVAACELAMSGQIDAIVTAPLHKAALQMAGHDVPGHTELLARCCGVPHTAMLLYLPPSPEVGGPLGLGVAHVTLHMALRKAIESLTTEKIEQVGELLGEFVERLAAIHALDREPRVAVAALNPHAGEHGLFGREELDLIAPAVERLREKWPGFSGPWSCDTLFARAAAGLYDAVLAMYHDQGHIALKLLGMHRAINITLGLPIVRTSVAHGTAFDIAWQGTADPSSLTAAIHMAKLLGSMPSLATESP